MIALTKRQALIRISVGLLIALLFNQVPFASFIAQQLTWLLLALDLPWRTPAFLLQAKLTLSRWLSLTGALFVLEVVGNIAIHQPFKTPFWWVVGLMGIGFLILLHARVGLLDAVGVGLLIPVMSALVSLVMVQTLHAPFHGPSAYALSFMMLYAIPIWLIADALVRLRLVER